MSEQRLCAQAVRFHRKGNLAEADRLYSQIIAAEPSSFGPRHLLGAIRHQQGRNAEALELIDAALKINPNVAETLSNYGMVLRALGRYEEALASYDKALAIKPNYTAALYHRGHSLQNLNRFEEALASFDKALAIKPDYTEALNSRGVSLSGLNRFEEALASIDKALAIKPDYAEALNNRGLVLQYLRRFEESLSSIDKALAIKPTYAAALSNRGLVLTYLRRFEESLASIDKALAIKPSSPEALYNRGTTLWSLNRLEESLANYDEALAVNPDFVEALNSRGLVLQNLRRSEEALASIDKALAIKPDFAEALNSRGLVLQYLGRFEEALASIDRALVIKSDYAEALANRGSVLQDLARFEEALTSFDEALAIKPDQAKVLHNRGLVLQYLGKLDEARTDYLEALALKPNMTGVYLSYADLVNFSAENPHLKKMEALRDGIVPLTDTDRLQLDFALAKAYADLKDYKRSFKRLLSGNALKRRQIHYDERKAMAIFDRIEATFTAKLLRDKEQLGGGDPSSIPIFILGMPRSGSTLIEQILSSHPDVHGAGELTTLYDVTREVRGPNGGPIFYPEYVSGLDAHALGQIAARYLTQVRKLAPTVPHITDKMPSNYYYAGLIHLALPNACIIHSVRDPLDTCISRFSKLFIDQQHYTYDLAELGRFHCRYQKLMAHWHRVLPQGRILDVQYEEVVADLEGQARRIVAHCGLEWDARCLSFHTTNRPVRTPSASQVRQPMYQSAVGRAHVYEEFLGPLKDALTGA